MIAIVALIVVGPERLPGAIRTASLWIGRAKRSFNQVKTEIEKEINADEIRRQLHNESILADLANAKKKADSLVSETRKNLDGINAEVNATLKSEEAKLAASNAESDAVREAATIPTPAAPVFNPATIDEDYEEPAVVSMPEPAPAAPVSRPPKPPVEDFYNNPSVGLIQLKGGVFSAAPAPESDANQPRKE
ncbi:MAG: Sec-independent protein translocase protein TatB [Gammaproteobacteria bacterium]|nr:Sec-independent protein translocase protein TatB [Gammaproteobacteria bacterium]